jgi:hypothetical protein
MGDVTAYHPGWVYHGLVVGTAEDAAQLLWSLLSGQPLKQDTIGQMITPRALPGYRSDLHPDTTHGLGLMLSSTAPRCTRWATVEKDREAESAFMGWMGSLLGHWQQRHLNRYGRPDTQRASKRQVNERPCWGDGSGALNVRMWVRAANRRRWLKRPAWALSGRSVPHACSAEMGAPRT